MGQMLSRIIAIFGSSGKFAKIQQDEIQKPQKLLSTATRKTGSYLVQPRPLGLESFLGNSASGASTTLFLSELFD